MKLKRKLRKKLIPAIFVIGLSLMLYPSVSNYWNSMHQTREIASYAEKVAETDPALCTRLLEDAQNYNRGIPERENEYAQTEEEKQRYPELLNLFGTGSMGYIEIPVLDVTLPIYHGTSDAVLQRGVGHVEWTALPVGGEGTHSVLSGHRGLPSSKLFTDLDKLIVGDTFTLQVLDRTMVYEVDQIKIVEPSDPTDLKAEADQDYCTLLTCTPYGINTHRMLVRGHRIEKAAVTESRAITSEAILIEPMLVAAFLFIPVLAAAFIGILISGKKS